jgi:hypothetical protein
MGKPRKRAMKKKAKKRRDLWEVRDFQPCQAAVDALKELHGWA